jgi:choline transport protein
MFVLVGACAATLAELASVYPTAGGQYHWTSILAERRWGRGIVSIWRTGFDENHKRCC